MKISDLGDTHPEYKCYGRQCVIHNPSDHHMLDWPINLRENKLIERICKHGVGHPDPDSVYFFDMIGQGGLGIHGCDGCCKVEEQDDEDEDFDSSMLRVVRDEPSHVFKAGQVWRDYGENRIVILEVNGDEITYCKSDGHDIMTAPSSRVFPNQEWGLIFPNPVLPGTVWKSTNPNNEDLVFILTAPDSKGLLDVAVANEVAVFEWHVDVITNTYLRVEFK